MVFQSLAKDGSHAALPHVSSGFPSADWKTLLRDSVREPAELALILDVDVEAIKRAHAEFPLRVNPYYLSLIERKGDPIWK